MLAEYHMAYLNGLRKGKDVKNMANVYAESRNGGSFFLNETGPVNYAAFVNKWN